MTLTGSEFSVPAYLLATYQPWRQYKIFIPKLSRYSHSVLRDLRPISLTSFLSNTMERLVDSYLTAEADNAAISS